MTRIPHIKLNDGNAIPQIGLGTWLAPDDEASNAVSSAFASGYRHVDTAAIYHNEKGVGQAIRACGIPREEIFVTTKLWNDDQGYDSALEACDASLQKLGLDYVDLYLIHWPKPRQDTYVDSWKALMRLHEEGKVKSIGVSNFNADHLERIMAETGITPAVNQIELHPRFQQRDLREFHQQHGIVTESWSPLGKAKILDGPVLQDIADKHEKTPAQVIIRWHVQNDLIVIPKSVNPGRIAQNINVFDFTLDAADMQRISSLDDTQGRIGPDPLKATF